MIRRTLKNIFGDRASLVFRAMLRSPEKEWTVRDFIQEGVSFTLANVVLNKAEEQGFVVRTKKGRKSSSVLVRKDLLLRRWTEGYSFSDNIQKIYQFSEKDFQDRCGRYLKERGICYAWTLFSGSRLISPYVMDNGHYLYVDVGTGEYEKLITSMRNHLGLMELRHGGNVCIALPYYRSSVFRDAREVKKFPVVSDLQLYLNIVNFPSGKEEADHLMKYWKKKEVSFV